MPKNKLQQTVEEQTLRIKQVNKKKTHSKFSLANKMMIKKKALVFFNSMTREMTRSIQKEKLKVNNWIGN